MNKLSFALYSCVIYLIVKSTHDDISPSSVPSAWYSYENMDSLSVWFTFLDISSADLMTDFELRYILRTAFSNVTRIPYEYMTIGEIYEYYDRNLLKSEVEMIWKSSSSHLQRLYKWAQQKPQEFLWQFNGIIYDIYPDYFGRLQIGSKYIRFDDYTLNRNKTLDIMQLISSTATSSGVLSNTKPLGYGLLYSVSDDISIKGRTFCALNWGWNETQVACREMGYDYGMQLHGMEADSDSFVDYTNIYYGNFDCDGSETSIFDCAHDTNAEVLYSVDCAHDMENAVHVYCEKYC